MKQAKAGERAAINYLIDKGWIITDVSDNPDYWKKDIDIIAERGNIKTSIEVKWDELIYKTNNMFIELSTDILEVKPGWINYTEAEYIFYGDAINGLFYVFHTEDMKDYLNKHTEQIKTSSARDRRKNKLSIGALVNPAQFQKYHWLQIIKLENRNIF